MWVLADAKLHRQNPLSSRSRKNSGALLFVIEVCATSHRVADEIPIPPCRLSVVECFGCLSSQNGGFGFQIVRQRNAAVSTVSNLGVLGMMHLNSTQMDRRLLHELFS